LPNVDQFESVFKAASKPAYHHEPISIGAVDVITDLPDPEARALGERVSGFLSMLSPEVRWRCVPGDTTVTVEQLLGHVERDRPDIVVTYRNLHTEAWQWPHSLGRHLDVLTQATNCPVLVVPHPRDRAAIEAALGHSGTVLAATDHLAGDGRLVRFAAGLAKPGATVVLAHVEDDAAFERYMEVISKIPEIDTDTAREAIMAQLLKEPRDYVDACRAELERARGDLEVVGEMLTGHRVAEYRALVEKHRAALLVIHTKDEDQHAMHGLAYPLAVELRRVPVLMV
jgi:hypothetical protein